MTSSAGTINLFLALRWCREKVLLEPKLGSALGTFSSAISVSVGFIDAVERVELYTICMKTAWWVVRVNEKLGGNFFDWRQEVTAFFAPSAQRNKQFLLPAL